MNNEPIKLTDYQDERFKSLVAEIIKLRPIKNLTEAEVQNTLRLLELHMLLGDKNWPGSPVDIRKNDARLANMPDEDKFLAMLLEYEQQELLLCSGNCIYRFGGTKYHWRKIGRTCPITTTASALNDCCSGYFGRGWLIAAHIRTLIEWIMKHPSKMMMLWDEALVKAIKSDSE